MATTPHRVRDAPAGVSSRDCRLAVQTFVIDDLNRRHHSVRRSYDTVAEEYAVGFRDELAGKPLDRALLACLAEQAEQGTAIADLGVWPRARTRPGWLAGTWPWSGSTCPRE